MEKGVQKIALPVFLRKGLQAYRIGKDKEQRYLLRASWNGKTYEFEPWQFFILETMPGYEDYSKLMAVFEDRFGHKITRDELDKFFSIVSGNKLFSVSAYSHPMLAGLSDWKEATLAETARTAPDSSPDDIESRKKEVSSSGESYETAEDAGSDDESLPAGVRDAIGLDYTMGRKGIKLFNPTWLIKILHPLLLPLRHAVYLLPLLFISALMVCLRYFPMIREYFLDFNYKTDLLGHALISLFSVNLLVTLLTALVAYNYRATVNGFCIFFYMLFFPRFMVRIGHVKQLSRYERIWLHAAPLILRLGLFSTGILVWFYARERFELIAFYAMAIAVASIISFLITVNPLVKSSGYHLLSAFVNEPRLRGKAFKALMNKIRGNVYKKADNNVLVAYTMLSLLFMFLFAAAMFYLLDNFLRIYLGGASIVLVLLIVSILLWRVIKKLALVQETYERSVQYERWRSRAFPEIEDEKGTEIQTNTYIVFLKRSALLLIIAALFLPYRYEPGGSFTILPNKRQVITAETGGIIESINFEGGEIVKKGTVIGRLSYSDYRAEADIITAKIKEQQSVINELKKRPIPEEIQLATFTLETQKTRAGFSKAKMERLQKLHQDGTIPFEDLEEVRRDYEVDQKKILEGEANLQLIKAGANEDAIAAAEARLQAHNMELKHLQEKIDQSIFRMPFDGRIITTHLQQKLGSYLQKGETLAVVENTDWIKIEVKVPEPDIGYVRENAEVRFRLRVYHDREFHGFVQSIDQSVTEERFGKVVKVLTLLENHEGKLKTGMTGYAKISSDKVPLWRVLSLAVIRFFKVEVWSWLP